MKGERLRSGSCDNVPIFGSVSACNSTCEHWIMETLKEKIASLGDVSSSKFAEEFMKAQQNLREKFPTPDSFMKLLKKMKDMTPEDREKFKESIGKNFQDFTQRLTKEKTPKGASYSQYGLFIAMVLIVIVVIGENHVFTPKDAPLSLWLSSSNNLSSPSLITVLRIHESAEFPPA